jgi:thiol-disulfide isomerase/thioredoxin
MISTLKYFSIFLFLLLVNCTSRPDQASEVALPKTDSSQDLSLNLMDEKMLQEFISSRNGKYLFLNVWATWCIPCREEFPDLIKLAELYKTKGVEFAGLSVDYPDEIESKILPFLEKNPVNFPIYVQNFKDKENAINLLNEKWSGAIPATFIYGADGSQLHFLLGKHSYEEFQQVLQSLLE